VAALLAAGLSLAATGTAASAVAASSPTLAVRVEPGAGYGFIATAIRSADRHVDLSMYEFEDPTMAAALAAAARAGVDVRVLLDSAYELKGDNTPAANYLRTHGVHVVWAPGNQIFHAKYLVIDDRILYVGTGNFTAQWYSSTRDYWVSDRDRTDVGAAEGRFGADFTGASDAWHGAAGHLVWSPGSTGALVRLIGSATRTLLVENEEMDSSPIEAALAAAARRHVHVEVVMTHDSEWTAALRKLVTEGVHVHVLSESQVYIHAKAICADCSGSTGRVFVGSENFSTSSLDYNRELGLISTAAAVVGPVRASIAADYAIGSSSL
jgi:phosphatidylserine/phosphatidylglycerophosphate/cardiolipin synthase-like enzyme